MYVRSGRGTRIALGELLIALSTSSVTPPSPRPRRKRGSPSRISLPRTSGTSSSTSPVGHSAHGRSRQRSPGLGLSPPHTVPRRKPHHYFSRIDKACSFREDEASRTNK